MQRMSHGGAAFKICALLLLCILSPIAAGDDDAYGYNDVSSSIEICSDSGVEVTGISLLCDSPGTYYYGSGKYRNNIHCKLGDKAKLTVTFEIVRELDEGTDPLITLLAQSDEATTTIYRNARLCYLGSIATIDGATCPSSGSFSISAQFYWEKDEENTADQSFYPIVSVGFHSEQDPNYYDLGGANTDMCQGNTYITINKFRYLSPLASLLLSLFILLGTVSVIGGVAWYLWRRSTFGPVPQDTFESYYSQELEPTVSDKQADLLRGNRQALINFQ